MSGKAGALVLLAALALLAAGFGLGRLAGRNGDQVPKLVQPPAASAVSPGPTTVAGTEALRAQLVLLEEQAQKTRVELAAREARERPAATPLPTATVSLQEMLDRAADGATVEIPRARYVSPKATVLRGRKDLRLRFAPGTEILCADVNEDVLRLGGCSGIKLEGGYFRHVRPLTEYQCHGSVLRLNGCRGIEISGAELRGCGAVGVHADSTRELKVTRCTIAENTFCAVYLQGGGDLEFTDNLFEKNASLASTYGVDSLSMERNEVREDRGYWNPPERR